MSGLNIVEQIDETIMDVVQKAEQNSGQIEGVDPIFRKLLREIYEIFQNQLLGVNEEDNNNKILGLLKNFCVYNRCYMIFEYSCSSLPNMSSKDMITSIFVLLLAEKLFSVFLMYLMSNDCMKQTYKKTAVLMNIDALVSLIKTFQFYESKALVITSKWIQHYESIKSSKNKKGGKDFKLDVPEAEKVDSFYESEAGFIQQLPDNDPIKIWYTNYRNFNLREFENSVKSSVEKESKDKQTNIKDKLFLKTKHSTNNDDDHRAPSTNTPNKNGEQVNQLFKAVKKMNEEDSEKDVGSFTNSSFASASVVPSRMLEAKLMEVVSRFDMKIFEAVDGKTPKSTACADCGQEFKGLFWMKSGNYCEQENEWFCNNCMHSEKTVIPWKVILSGDASVRHEHAEGLQARLREDTSHVQRSLGRGA